MDTFSLSILFCPLALITHFIARDQKKTSWDISSIINLGITKNLRTEIFKECVISEQGYFGKSLQMQKMILRQIIQILP